LASLLVLRATPSQAHAVGVSRGEYRADEATVRADLVFARKELLTALPGLDADGDGELSSGEVERAHGDLAGWLRRGLVVRLPSGPCDGGLDGAALTEQDGVELTAVYRCPAPATGFSIRLPLLADLSLGHRHLLAATSPTETVHTVLFAAQPEMDVSPPSTVAVGSDSIAPSPFRLGVEHILTGWDHLLFLLAVVLLGGSLRSVLRALIAFTLGHSLTLAVVAQSVWAPPPMVVKAAIALSIVYVGIESCVVKDVRRRGRLTFLFGVVHGFGFAGALHEVAVSAAQLPFALASFNVGLEVGQLAVLAVVLPWTAWLGGRRWFAAGGLRASSVAISAIGLCWFVVRATGG
jgi:hydrogenase/urease accessory protein HupE